MKKKSNFKPYVIDNPTLPKDQRALPTEFKMTPAQADAKNKELAKEKAPGRFVESTAKSRKKV